MSCPAYSRQELESMKRSQLWEICAHLGLHRFAKKSELIAVILEKMSGLVEESEEIHLEEESKPQALIINDDEDYEPWVLVSGGLEIARSRTFLMLLNSPAAKGFEIANLDDQTSFDSLAVWKSPQELEEEKQKSNQELDELIPDSSTCVEPVLSVVEMRSRNIKKREGLSICFICRLEKERLYAVNFNGVLVGYFAVESGRGSGRISFLASSASPDDQLIDKSKSADSCTDVLAASDNNSILTAENLPMTT